MRRLVQHMSRVPPSHAYQHLRIGRVYVFEVQLPLALSSGVSTQRGCSSASRDTKVGLQKMLIIQLMLL